MSPRIPPPSIDRMENRRRLGRPVKSSKMRISPLHVRSEPARRVQRGLLGLEELDTRHLGAAHTEHAVAAHVDRDSAALSDARRLPTGDQASAARNRFADVEVKTPKACQSFTAQLTAPVCP